MCSMSPTTPPGIGADGGDDGFNFLKADPRDINTGHCKEQEQEREQEQVWPRSG